MSLNIKKGFEGDRISVHIKFIVIIIINEGLLYVVYTQTITITTTTLIDFWKEEGVRVQQTKGHKREASQETEGLEVTVP